MIDYLELVKEFHTKYNHYMPETLQGRWTIPAVIEKLRDDLIMEEAAEFLRAKSPEELAKELADILYVVFGAALAYGIPIEEVFAEVHLSNMTKSADKEVSGKTVKGPGYKRPRIHEILYLIEPPAVAGNLD